jgi:hypothetical protein
MSEDECSASAPDTQAERLAEALCGSALPGRFALKWRIGVHTLYDELFDMKRHILPLFCLIACFLPAPAAVAGQACVVFTVKDLSATPATRDYEETITQAVGAAFGAGGYEVIGDAAWREAAAARSVDPGRPVTQSEALAIAGSVGADLAVTGIYSVQNDEIYYSIQCWSVQSGTLAAALQADTPFNLAFFSGLNLALADDLLPRLPAAGQGAGSVVFSSPDEGMVVRLSGDQFIGRVVNGRVTLPADSVVPGSRVVIRKSKAGYHAAEQTVTLTPNTAIPLAPLEKEHRNALELNSTLGQLLGLGGAFRLYVVPDWFFVSAGSYLWMQPPANLALRAVLHTDFYAGLSGYMFLDPDVPVRLGISTGAGVILSFLTAPGFPVFTDVYIDVFNWWVEARFFGLTFFLRQELKYDVGLGANLLGQGWMIRNFPPTSLGIVIPW